MEASRITKPRQSLIDPNTDTANRPPRPPANNPFLYGWRYVRRLQAGGTETFEQVPLSLQDILHPEVGDFRVLSDPHNDDCAYLKYVIHSRLPADGLVLSDCQVDWGVPGLRPHGPDIAAFRGVRRRKEWSSFHVKREKARTLFAVEVTSPSTRSTDLVDKVDHYYRAGVPLYFIVDAYLERDDQRILHLLGYRRGKTGYVAFKPDAQGRFHLKPLPLLLGIEGSRVACYDAQTLEKIGDYHTVLQERDAAQEKVRQLEAELRRLRGEA